MKAIICTKYGPPEVLKLTEVKKPTPEDNEVLVKVFATTVTTADSRVRGFRVPLSFWLLGRIALGLRKPKNDILGVELAGKVESVGKDVKRFKEGESVFAFTGVDPKVGFGAYVEYKRLPEDSLIATKPTHITDEEAASISFGGTTALYFLRKANIHKGQNILIYGASGCVGTYAIQLSRYFGAKVTGVCSTDNVELVKSLGADEVIDYTRENFSKNDETYDVVFDVVGKTSFSDCMRSLGKEGVYLQAVAAPALSIRMLWTSKTSSRKLIGGTASPKIEDIIFLKELIENGKIKSVIDRRYPLEQIADAHSYVDKGHKKGSVVITLDHL